MGESAGSVLNYLSYVMLGFYSVSVDVVKLWVMIDTAGWESGKAE
jgi:hypothetical protein